MPALVAHPQSPAAAVQGITAEVRRAPGGLTATFAIEGDLQALRIPPPRPPTAVQGLWEHTCCEVFLARRESPAYREFNLSPSGEWAAYDFERYREGRRLADAALDPRIEVRTRAGRLELAARIRGFEGALLVGLAAVLEAADGALSYWALRHAPGRPDFHHRDAFALELA